MRILRTWCLTTYLDSNMLIWSAYINSLSDSYLTEWSVILMVQMRRRNISSKHPPVLSAFPWDWKITFQSAGAYLFSAQSTAGRQQQSLLMTFDDTKANIWIGHMGQKHQIDVSHWLDKAKAITSLYLSDVKLHKNMGLPITHCMNPISAGKGCVRTLSWRCWWRGGDSCSHLAS